MIVRVQNISKSPIPTTYENVVQIDYVHYEETEYSGEIKVMSLLIKNKDDSFTRHIIDLTPDVQIIILNDEV